jgi:predicted O-methyltransferase YrrM
MRRISRHTPRDRAHRRRLSEAAARLHDAPEPGAGLLADAIDATLRLTVSADVRAWFDRVEAERARLLEDQRELPGEQLVSDVTRKASVPRHQAALLFHLVRQSGASRCLEMGTCVGVSGSYLGAAMELGGGGTLRSLEGQEERAEIARETFANLGFDDAEVVVGRFHRTLEPVLDSEPFDFVFIDGHHDGEATKAYAAQIMATCRPGAVIVFDDISWSKDMRAAWKQIRSELRDSASCDLKRLGLVVLGPKDAGQA